MRQRHEELIGGFSEEDESSCHILCGLAQVCGEDAISNTCCYIAKLIEGNTRKKIYPELQLESVLFARVLTLESEFYRNLHLRERSTLNARIRRLSQLSEKYELQRDEARAQRDSVREKARRYDRLAAILRPSRWPSMAVRRLRRLTRNA